MKSKLLQGIIKDLMKVPMSHGEKPKGEMHITIAGHAGPEAEEMEEPTDPLEDAMDPDKAKHMSMNKAIHAKGHKGF